MSAIKYFTTRVRAEEKEDKTRQEFNCMLKVYWNKIPGSLPDTHHHVDPLPRFLFLLISSSDACTVTKSTARTIQSLIFRRSVSRVVSWCVPECPSAQIRSRCFLISDRGLAPVHTNYHWTNIFSRYSRSRSSRRRELSAPSRIALTGSCAWPRR